jgi:hypothetical protein
VATNFSDEPADSIFKVKVKVETTGSSKTVANTDGIPVCVTQKITIEIISAIYCTAT